MKYLLMCMIASLVTMASSALAADGLTQVKSPYPATETMNRFEMNAKQKGLTIFARIDHAAGALKIGKKLRSTEVIVFGNPQGGTSFMECGQTVGIDLPLKALVWEDAQGQVWLGYNDPTYLAKRHGIATCAAAANLTKALSGLTQATIAPEIK